MIIIDGENNTRTSNLEEKIRELCESILNDAQVQSARDQVDAFLEDDEARELYAGVMQKSEQLHQKQQAGEELTDEDISAFNGLRDRAFGDSRVQNFSAARSSLQAIEDKIVAYVEKTLELGRVPEPEEVVRQGGCCGGGSCGSGGGGNGGCC
jgi:cell fate (sporulation/competence/biofilm development) regulator YlbF (YheA/YmcA/DUF963 family)